MWIVAVALIKMLTAAMLRAESPAILSRSGWVPNKLPNSLRTNKALSIEVGQVDKQSATDEVSRLGSWAGSAALFLGEMS